MAQKSHPIAFCKEEVAQALVSKIIAGTVSTISSIENVIINEFYALWYMRARYRNLDTQEIQLNKVTGENITKDQEEILEKKGILFIREGGRNPARQMNGIQIQRWIDAYTSEWLLARLNEKPGSENYRVTD